MRLPYNVPMLGKLSVSRCIRWLVLLGILLALSTVCWGAHPRPHRLRYVASFGMAGEGMDIWSLPTGFFTRDGDTFIMRDWHTGRTRWRVTAVNKNGWGQPHSGWSQIDNSSFAISWDGRYFAAATVQRSGVRIRRWYNGKPTGNFLVLPSHGKPPKPAYYQLAVRDHGRIFLQYFYDKQSTQPERLLVIDGHRIVMNRKQPVRAMLLRGGALAYNAETGKLFGVRVAGKRIRFTRLAGGMTDYRYTQFPNNYVLSEHGAVYTPTGKILPASRWRKLDMQHLFRRSNNGWPTDWIVKSLENGRHTISSLATIARWTLQTRPHLMGVAVSADGRFVLLYQYEEPVKKNLERRPLSGSTLASPDSDRADSIWLYERPGILRAYLRYVPEESSSDGDREFGYSCNGWILSPDGRSVILEYDYMGDGGEARLYRW